jgi:predicted nucleic acid-binding protein
MKSIVVDSSVTVKWINQEEEKLLEQADKLLMDVRSGSVSLLAPELSKYEIGNALLRKNLELEQAYVSLGTIYQLPITFVPESEELSRKTYKIASEYGVTYYDASFIALAEQQGAVLVTDNFKHQGKTQTFNVIALKDY